MKRVRVDGDRQVFRLEWREQGLLFALLSLYPLIPPGHFRLSRGGLDGGPEAQRLLEEALAEQRQEHRRQVQALVTDGGRMEKVKGGYEWSLSGAEVEWLLQVLNDVRVGSWLRLGEPDERSDQPPAGLRARARLFTSMELSVYFEQCLLRAAAGEE